MTSILLKWAGIPSVSLLSSISKLKGGPINQTNCSLGCFFVVLVSIGDILTYRETFEVKWN